MRVQELAKGLWRWTGLHPDWTPEQGGPEGWEQEVGCVYYEAPEAVVLVDPLAPQEDEERFWRALDRDVERAAKPVHVVVTVKWHGRSSEEIERRYGAKVGGPLPRGLEAYDAPPGQETVFWIPEHAALVFGDVVLGTEGGGVRLCPESWLDGTREELEGALRPLLDLPVERLLVSHGEPVLANAREALAQALSAAER
jgi:glyoxylase-like metal-dependent hydrolase (beta-lactamase superfamily II)